MTSQPLISLVMPAYNAGNFIEASIRSVLGQSYTNWELLITNDGSTDGTEAVVRSFDDSRIRLFSQENKGVSAARNKALTHMKGSYFTFLDADDLLPAGSLQKRIAFAVVNPDVQFIAGSVEFFNDTDVVRTWRPSYKGDPLQAFIRIDERAFCNPALLIKRVPQIHYQFKEGMSHVEDLLFFASIAEQKRMKFDFIEDVVYRYRVTGTSAMSNLAGLEKGYWTFYESVKKFANAQQVDVRYLKMRITRIMFLSYLAAGKVGSALRVVSKILSQ